EFTPRAIQVVNTIIGVKPLDEDTIEVYVDYWHFDKSEIADWTSMWSVMPWELVSAMEQSVIDGKVSFSRSGATSKNVNWLSLIVPNDAKIIEGYLSDFKNSNHIPSALKSFVSNQKYFESRYDASINWIQENNHAIISNGPFFLDRYSPESRTITIKAFDDPTYPIKSGTWSEFETVQFPQIENVELPELVVKGEELSIPIQTKDTTRIQYFLTNSEGNIVESGVEQVSGKQTTLTLSGEKTERFLIGANDLKVFAMSDTVLRPDIFSTSFLVVDSPTQELPKPTFSETQQSQVSTNNYGYLVIVAGATAIGIFLYVKSKLNSKKIEK
ncbi:MAG: ABC transporter substrate-binding protein, partial [Nitrosopumilaceae archaeon]